MQNPSNNHSTDKSIHVSCARGGAYRTHRGQPTTRSPAPGKIARCDSIARSPADRPL